MNNRNSPYTSGRGSSSNSPPSQTSEARIVTQNTDQGTGISSEASFGDFFKHQHQHQLKGAVGDQALASAALKKYEHEKAKMPSGSTSFVPTGQILQLPTGGYSTQITPRPLPTLPMNSNVTTNAGEDQDTSSQKRARRNFPSNTDSPSSVPAGWPAPLPQQHMISASAAAQMEAMAAFNEHRGLAPGVPIMSQGTTAQQSVPMSNHINGVPLRLPSSTLGGFPGLNPLVFALQGPDMQQTNRLTQFLNSRHQGVDPSLLTGSIGLFGHHPSTGTIPGVYGDFGAFAGTPSQLLQGSGLFRAHHNVSMPPPHQVASESSQQHLLPQSDGHAARTQGTKRSRSGTKTSLSSVRVEGLLSGAEIAKLENLPKSLPAVLALPEDEGKLSAFQLLLRNQIEAFTATSDDVTTHARGRNRPIALKQVGIRCRHCKHLPTSQRTKGSVYFPFSLVGLYQAAQNMGASHFQGESCSEMPEDIKHKFLEVLACKSTIGAGKAYWARAAQKVGLVDTEEGIRFIRDLEGSSQSG